jgi:FkbM family methyltransferase
MHATGRRGLELRKVVRTAQTYAAPFVDVKAWTQRTVRQIFRIPSETSYRAFRSFPLQAGEQFLDIGANRGQTIASIRLYKPVAPILAFEPNSILARRLTERYADDYNITIHSFGLGLENGHFDLYVPYYRGFVFDGLASLDWAAAHDWLNEERIYGFDRRHLRIETLRCEVRRWDDVDTRPGLVKIDVQGFESNVLRGGIGTIRSHRPVFVIENDPQRGHESILLPEDYRRASYRNGRLMLDKVGLGNTFYIPAEKARQIQAAYR